MRNAYSLFLLIFSRGAILLHLMHATKTELRARFDSYRRNLSDSEYERLTNRILDRIVGVPELITADTVHVYWPMTDRREVDTRPLIERLRAQGKEVVLPVVVSFQSAARDAPRMEHVRYFGEDGLRLNRWGIAEPIKRESVAIADLDVVVVPAMGADRNGHRIGYGHGFYDVFLRQLTAPKVALVYHACLVKEIPIEAHDVPMDILVTENDVIRPTSTPGRGASS